MPPVVEKYKGETIRDLLDKMLDAGPKVDLPGGATDRLYYSNETTVVMTPASDKDNPRNPLALDKLFTKINDTKSTDGGVLNGHLSKDIIFPISEAQKILGIFPRMHWVTVHYSQAENKATLIDSRPWYVSIWYPTSPMEKMLRKGLGEILGEKAKDMSFKTVYQGVQHNDIHCGSWVVANTGYLVEKKASIGEIKKIFTSDDEQNIVEFNKRMRASTDSKEPKKGFFQRLMDFFSNNLTPSAQQNNYSGGSNEVMARCGVTYNEPLQTVQSVASSDEAKYEEDFDFITDPEDENVVLMTPSPNQPLPGSAIDNSTGNMSVAGDSAEEGFEIIETPVSPTKDDDSFLENDYDELDAGRKLR